MYYILKVTGTSTTYSIQCDAGKTGINTLCSDLFSVPFPTTPNILLSFFIITELRFSQDYLSNSETHSLVIMRLQPQQQNKHAEQGQQQGSGREIFKDIL